LTAVAAAVVRGETVAVYQDAGWRDWWTELGDWPASFERTAAWPREDRGALLAISDRAHPEYPGLSVVHRPPSLVLGVGCRRGVPAAEIEELFQRVCSAHGFASLSLGVVATASIKADEPGLREFAAQHGAPLRSFSLEELAAVAPLPTPSAAVQAKIGIPGVAEPAALLAAGATTLLLPKQRGARVAMALARKEDA
jgi:cobalamin biosynthesis protein CbiG